MQSYQQSWLLMLCSSSVNRMLNIPQLNLWRQRKFQGKTKRTFLYNPATIKKNIYKANATEMSRFTEVQLLYTFTQSDFWIYTKKEHTYMLKYTFSDILQSRLQLEKSAGELYTKKHTPFYTSTNHTNLFLNFVIFTNMCRMVPKWS